MFRCFYDPKYDLSCECSMCTWKENVYYAIASVLCVLWMSSKLSWLTVFNLLSPYWFSVHLFYVGNRKAEISNFNFGFIFSLVISISFHFMYFEALLLGTHLFRIIMLSWWINPFIIMLHLLVILVIFLVLKPTLFDINIATLDFSWLTFTW